MSTLHELLLASQQWRGEIKAGPSCLTWPFPIHLTYGSKQVQLEFDGLIAELPDHYKLMSGKLMKDWNGPQWGLGKKAE